MRTFLLINLVVATASLLQAHELPPLPQPVTSFGAVISDGNLYTYGGHQAGSHSWSLETTSKTLNRLKLDDDTTWESISTGPAVQSPGVAAYDGKIYLVGGMQPQNEKGQPPVLKSLDHVQSFDPKTYTWTDLPKLPAVRSSHDIAIYEGKLYVVGGWPLDTSKDSKDKEADDRHTVREFHKESLVLDLAHPENGWQSIPQPFERRAIAVVASKGKIYALGGMNAKNEVSAEADVYDIATKTWSKLPEIPVEGRVKAFATAACELDGEVITSPRGGKVFALRNDAWVEVGQLTQSRFFHQLEPHEGSKVIALGGTAGEDPLGSVEIVSIKPAAATVSK